MPIFKRPDGSPAKKVPSYTKMLPYIMKGRNEAVIYYSHDFDMANALAFLKKKNKGLKVKKYGIFHIYLLAAARTLALRPRLNRFVLGRKIYQRKKIRISFVAKQSLEEDAKEINITLDIDPFDTLEIVVEKLGSKLNKIRKGEDVGGDEKEMDVVTRLPRFMINMITWIFTKLDYHNLAPKSMINVDPLYASIFMANLGSVDLPGTPYHHLFEWGTASIFMVIGKLKKIPVVNEKGKIVVGDVMNVKFSLDDRIGEAMYFAKALSLVDDFVRHPEKLEKPPVIGKEALDQLNLK